VAPPALDAEGPVLCDPTMRHLYALLDVIAPTPLNVLVLGETGVGKELYAESVHKRSDRRGAPFLRLNCAALAESILEGELFGYEKGAFTGAVQAKAGLFESADGGTVFLDEIGEVPLSIQAKLLRVLESGEMMRLGSLHPRKVDVRFVAATNRDLRQRIVDGAFRADLYFRLNGMTITLPPLRKRKADIAPLASFLIERTALRLRRRPPLLSDEAIDALSRYAWPGNVRELRNLIERAVVMCKGDELGVSHLITADPEAFGEQADDLPTQDTGLIDESTSVRGMATLPRTPVAPPELLHEDRPSSLRDELKVVEKQRILDALAKSGGNQSQAGKLLGISRYTLMSRMEEHGIARPRKK
jgi:transcriptional regulator with PAS, ATPase and Fis domain